MTHEEFRDKKKISSEQAHKELFEAYCGYVYTIVFNRLRSVAAREDIEECLCDVFADVYCYYDPGKNVSGDMSGFIGTIARRKAAALYKSIISGAETVSIDDESAQQRSGDSRHGEAHTGEYPGTQRTGCKKAERNARKRRYLFIRRLIYAER